MTSRHDLCINPCRHCIGCHTCEGKPLCLRQNRTPTLSMISELSCASRLSILDVSMDCNNLSLSSGKVSCRSCRRMSNACARCESVQNCRLRVCRGKKNLTTIDYGWYELYYHKHCYQCSVHLVSSTKSENVCKGGSVTPQIAPRISCRLQFFWCIRRSSTFDELKFRK